MKLAKYTLILGLLFCSLCFAEERNIISGTKEIPIELNLLLKSYQDSELPKEQYQKLLQKIYMIDSLAKNISKEELFFSIKSEIYKTVLKFGNSTKLNFVLDDGKQLAKAAKLSKDPFIKWLLTALNADAESVFSSGYYKDYLVQKNNGKFLTLETKKLSKKVQLIAKLYYKINPDEPDNIKNELFPLFDECLNNIEETLFLVASESRFEKIVAPLKEGEPLQLFKIEIFKPAPVQKVAKKKSVEEILDSTPQSLEEEAISNHSNATQLPTPSSENWTEEESSPINMKNLPKPNNNAGWLEDF